jgi:hypothetical protein
MRSPDKGQIPFDMDITDKGDNGKTRWLIDITRDHQKGVVRKREDGVLPQSQTEPAAMVRQPSLDGSIHDPIARQRPGAEDKEAGMRGIQDTHDLTHPEAAGMNREDFNLREAALRAGGPITRQALGVEPDIVS